MDAPSRRRTYGRIPGLALLSILVLAAFSVIFVSSSVGGVEGPASASHVYRREASAGARLEWRQEGGEEAADLPGSSSGGTNSTTATETATGTRVSTTPEGVITTTTTRNVTSTTTTRASTSTTTVISTTTTRSTTSSPISTTSSSIPSTTTTSTSTSSIPSPSSSSAASSSSPVLKAVTTATSDTPATTLFVPADFLTLTSSSASSSTQSDNGVAGESDPTSTANAGGAVGATQKGFFQNKGAVAGVFVVVALVAMSLIGLLFIHVARRRSAARQRRLHAQLFGGKYTKSDDSHDPPQMHGRSGSGGSNGGSEKGIVYDNSRFRGATVTSDYPFGPGQGLAAFASSSNPPPLSQPSPPPMQQTSVFLPPSQNPSLVQAATLAGQNPSSGSAYVYHPPNSSGGHSLESHYTHEDPFYTPPASEAHSPNPNIGLQPVMIPALTVTSPHNTQYLARVPSGSTIFSQPRLTQVQGDGASTYSQQSFDGLAYDYRNSDVFAAGGSASSVVPPGGLRGSYGQTSIDSFYGGPASGGVKGPTVTVQY